MSAAKYAAELVQMRWFLDQAVRDGDADKALGLAKKLAAEVGTPPEEIALSDLGRGQ